MKTRHALIAIVALSVGFSSLAEAQRGGRRGPDRPGNGTAQFQPRGEQRGEGGPQSGRRNEGEGGPQSGRRNEGEGGPQSGRRGGGALAALELTAEQQEQLQALRETQHAERELHRESGERPTDEEREQIHAAHQEAIAAILTPDQLTQLEELKAQRPEGRDGKSGQGRRGGPHGQAGPRGGGALAALELTAEQQEQLQALRETQHAERELHRESGERPTDEEREQIHAAHQEAIAAILTPDQLAQLEELKAQRPERPSRGTEAEKEEESVPAAKPAGATIESISWGHIKSQAR